MINYKYAIVFKITVHREGNLKFQTSSKLIRKTDRYSAPFFNRIPGEFFNGIAAEFCHEFCLPSTYFCWKWNGKK